LNSKLKKKKAKDEILFYKEIIKVLQAELSEKVLYNKLGDSEQVNNLGEQIKAPFMEKDWVLVAAKNNKKLDDLNRNLIQILPTAVNSYDLLHNLKEEEKSTNTVMEDLRTRNISNYFQIKKRVTNVESQRNYKHKVWLIGDSHVRKCAAELR
jgi:50S ribosomal subunit-associated GTPase HflX